MSNPQVSISDLASLMKAAELDSSSMKEDNSEAPQQNTQISPSTEPSVNATTSLPTIPQLSNMKETLNNTNISTVLSKISQNPEELNKVMEESLSQMTPEMMEQAKKLAMGGQGQQMVREMQRRGIDQKAMHALVLGQQKALKEISAKSSGPTKKVILITSSRQLKMRNVPISSIQPSVARIINSSNVVELSCSRLAAGPLEGKTIKVWCDTERKGKNKRASKIVGFQIAGEILIIMEEGDLNEKDFLAAEKLLA